VAKCLWGFINLYNCKAPKENKGEWLGSVYSEANKKILENDILEEEVREINKKLYEGDKEIVKLWKMTREWCLDDFDKIYNSHRKRKVKG
jgi:arginyl-tRNA synthetase